MRSAMSSTPPLPSAQSVRDRIALFNSAVLNASANDSSEDLTAAAPAVGAGPSAGPSAGPTGPTGSPGTVAFVDAACARQTPPPRPTRKSPPSASAAGSSAPSTSSSPAPSEAAANNSSAPAGWVAFGSGSGLTNASTTPYASTAMATANTHPIVPARPPVAAFSSFNSTTPMVVPSASATATTVPSQPAPPPRPTAIVPPPGARPLVPIPTSTAASPVSSLNHPLASAPSSNAPPPLPPRVGHASAMIPASSDMYSNLNSASATSATTSRSASPVSLSSNSSGTPRRTQPPPPPTRAGNANGSLPRSTMSAASASAAAAALPPNGASVTTNQLVGLVKNVSISTSQASLSGRSSPTNPAKASGLPSNTTADSLFPRIPAQTRSRYLSLFWSLTNTMSPSATLPVDASTTAPAPAIVEVWRRSKLPLATLADVWDAVVPEPRATELNGLQFASGMWMIDQVLGGKRVDQVLTLAVDQQ